MIDFHVHTFPDAIAGRTMDKLSAIAGLVPKTNGTLADAQRRMDEWGVSAYVLQNVATKPSQQHTINNTAASLQRTGRFAFGSIHPDAEDAVAELERMTDLGLKGVKLHPDYQGFFIDEARLDPIYDAIGQLGLMVLFHTGYDPLSPNVIHAEPAGVAAVHRRFPKMRMIAAHLGGIADHPEQAQLLVGQDIYLDVSIAAARFTPEEYDRLLRRHGAERVLLASDCPWGGIPEGLERLRQTSLTQRELRRICCENAAELLGLSHE